MVYLINYVSTETLTTARMMHSGTNSRPAEVYIQS
jgi:hypothetical protein